MRKHSLASLCISPPNRAAVSASLHPEALREMNNFRYYFSKCMSSRTRRALNTQKIRFCLSNMQMLSGFNNPNPTAALKCSVSHYSIPLLKK